MPVLVTGASGFLGGRLAQRLVERGDEVRILARETSDLSQLDTNVIEVARGSLEQPDTLKAATKGVTKVYHCAGMSADWGTWDEFRTVNIDGVRSLLAAARTIRPTAPDRITNTGRNSGKATIAMRPSITARVISAVGAQPGR